MAATRPSRFEFFSRHGIPANLDKPAIQQLARGKEIFWAFI
jgi:hypothetical protein